MPHITVKGRKGFSILELSIVIVIIGLLTGGVVGMRSYSRNAQLTTTMNEGKYYINAFNQFMERYNAAPGDFKTASLNWASAGNGDGNGLIRATATPPGNRDEWFYSFQHLTLAGLVQGKYTGATTGSAGTYYARIGTNVPGASKDGVAFLFDNPDFTDGSPDGFLSGDTKYFDGQYGNILVVAGLNGNATDIPNLPFLNPKQAVQLDEKYDDGLPGKGIVLTPISTALPGCATNTSPVSALYDTTPANANETKCYLLFRMQ